MWFITLYKFRKRPTKADIEHSNRTFKKAAKEGVKTFGVWWTLGRFDAVRVFEAKNAKQAMALGLDLPAASSETLVAISRNEAVKLLK